MTVPEGQQCKADGCTARRVKHGAGRCEAHFKTLRKYIESNPNDSEAGVVRRALDARKRMEGSETEPDGPGKGSTPPDLPEALAAAVEARDPGAVLAALSRGIDPEATAPSPEELADWSETPEVAPAQERDNARLRKLAAAMVDRDPRAPAGLAAAARFAAAPEWLPRMEDATPALAAWLPWRVAPVATPEDIADGFRDAFGKVPEATAESTADPAARLYRAELGDAWPEASVWLLMARGWASLARDFLAAREHDDSLQMPGEHLVRAWIERAGTVAVDRRSKGIIPGVLGSLVHAVGRERLPRLDIRGALGPSGPAQGTLPGLEPEPSALVPSLPLAVWNSNAEGQPGGGVPLRTGLWFEAVMAAELKRRGQRGVARLPVTLADLIEWAGWKRYERHKHLPMLRRALLGVDQTWVAWERRDWKLVAPQALPRADTKPGDVLPIHVMYPDGSGSGPLIDRYTLRGYRPRNAPAYRAWARLAYLWDKYGTRKGRRIYATRPEVLRSPEGHPVDATGAVIVERGKAVHWSHPGCVRTGKRERNPQADRIPVLTSADRVLLCFDGAVIDRAAYRLRKTRANRVLAAMEAEGRIVIERGATDRKGRRGWRVLEPLPEAPDG